ncbi:hypothetical protein OS493_033626 [Desmophyllum pertusum]|uniref:Uncharacterized protein n=1 Tax=Desmophyllum pertusum TaxID=174260 RepID=A0A9X0CIC0_9CNID|nr:hypothetical protein OS493_033626 [Desmophyllum pertusum]
MELKLLIIAVLFLGICAAFSLPEEQENNEDTPSEEEAPELDESRNCSPPFRCRKGWRRKCFSVKHCYRRLRICRCFPFKRYDGDETEFDNQVNDEMIETPEDQTEEFDETNQELEDPNRVRPRRCPRWFIRKCFIVRHGRRRLRICTCVRRCRYRGDEAQNDY